MKKSFSRFVKCHDGVAAIEFALIGGLAVSALLGGVEYATWIRDQRLAASASTAAAQSIADSGTSTNASRLALEAALKIMGGQHGSDMAVNVYNVTADEDGDVSVANTWSTGSEQMSKSGSSKDWEIIKPYLTADEGGIVACAYKKHTWRFLMVDIAGGALVKSCNAAVSVTTPTIDWQ